MGIASSEWLGLHRGSASFPDKARLPGTVAGCYKSGQPVSVKECQFRGTPVDTRCRGTASRRRRIVPIAAGFAVLAASGALYWYWSQGPDPARIARPATRAAVPVSVAVASRRDLPVYLTGLGTVQASFTVGIHSQVDGKLQEVLFTEGQHVKKGDVLAKIDPRLFQAALDQAKAKRAQNVALLAGAEKDLMRAKTLADKNAGSQ